MGNLVCERLFTLHISVPLTFPLRVYFVKHAPDLPLHCVWQRAISVAQIRGRHSEAFVWLGAAVPVTSADATNNG